jgi:DNA-directed RNA polymerase subunit RPC12/RpoP
MYKILVVCAGCGHTLYAVRNVGRGGRGAGHLSIERVRRRHNYTCPRCGRRLGVKPGRIKFMTLKEYEGHSNPNPNLSQTNSA